MEELTSSRFNATTAFLLPFEVPTDEIPRAWVSMPPRRSCFFIWVPFIW